MHTAIPVSWLNSKGYSYSLIHKYAYSHWVNFLAHGFICRPDDKIEWSGLLWGLQQSNRFHVGGKTALELQGKAHFIKFAQEEIFVFSARGFKLPPWLNSTNKNLKFVNISTNLLPMNVGMKKYNFGEYTLSISNPARAFLEYMHLAGKYHSFEEAYYLMENLHSLNPELMQEVLEACTSIKVKRLVLCLAKKQDVGWFKNLNLNEISLGTGVRQAVKNGSYDNEFLITYPKSWDIQTNEVPF